MRQFIEIDRRVDPRGRLSAQSFLNPSRRAFYSFIQQGRILDCQFPDDGVVGLNVGLYF